MEVSKVMEKLKGYKHSIYAKEESFKYSVLLPLMEVNGETHILFEVRSKNLRRQPGEICFPGGKIDEGETQEQCAMRETSEELGIDTSLIEDVIALDIMMNASSNIIYPFVGQILKPERIEPNISEVEEIFTVPLQYFQNNSPEIYKIHFHVVPDKDFPLHLIPNGKNYKWQTRHLDEYFYQFEDKVIWGLTAKILYNFITLIKK